jgi:hypothetical protein
LDFGLGGLSCDDLIRWKAVLLNQLHTLVTALGIIGSKIPKSALCVCNSEKFSLLW